MNFSYTQDGKPLVKDKNGFFIRDLSFAPTNVRFDYRRVLNASIVTDEYNMRIDNISKVLFGTVDFAEHILKANGISNPFSIGEDDLIIIPDIGYYENQYSQSLADSSDNNIRAYYTNKNKIPKTDTTYAKYTIDKNQQSLPIRSFEDEQLPPNIAGAKDKDIKIVNGKIVFGEDVTKNSDDNCVHKKTLSKSEFYKRLIKHNINQ